MADGSSHILASDDRAQVSLLLLTVMVMSKTLCSPWPITVAVHSTMLSGTHPSFQLCGAWLPGCLAAGGTDLTREPESHRISMNDALVIGKAL